MLNLSRAAQGVGGAIMFATSLALIAQAFAGKERGTAIGIYGAVIGGAVAIGPLVGGAITTGIGWRWIFFLNIPIGVVAVIITLTKVDNAKIQTGRRIDWLGFVTFTSSLFLLVYALVQGNDKGWGSTYIVSMLVGSVLLMAIFIVGEWQQQDPMLDLTLFKRPAMVGVSLGLLHAVGLDLRHVPLPDPLPPGGPRLLGTGRRPPVPAAQHARLHRGPRSPASSPSASRRASS